MDLVLFDLDNTLLSGDSDYEWGRYMCEIGAVDRAYYEKTNQDFYAAYCAGTLDMDAYLQFSLKPLANYRMEQLHAWRQSFIDSVIVPMITPPALNLVAQHRNKDDTLVVISSTNRFLVEPITHLFGIENVIATDAEIINNRFSGNVKGISCFGKNKLTKLKQWLETYAPDYQRSWFYSDSVNDLETLQWVDCPVVVNGDSKLLEEAARRGWQTIDLQ